ncbi:unnamed protein product [Bursaphelenchus xylophilus]|uniref:(pine wood nematode) hypothetical protein n=1 Tax=Bursaphelenchus xylophilus TaxID=6326 RepID=A0A1I7S1D1_BURXY|nr:unnamed protein product [Bursaphelenchus xylophilus]CAG9080290.1 unnamed protein product [Bursaphelenchus xylophilus]
MSDFESLICADCGAGNAEWASINRGVFICNECCYIHQNLGRHISQVRSLRKGVWVQSQLELLKVLYENGSNNIWEHILLDPQNERKSSKKPVSNDPVFPKKENFIKQKYLQNEFTIRPSKEERNSLEDLNRQLWSVARSSRVETTLKLLALGADPNYADVDNGLAAVHVAAKEGQILQIELLAIYGADVAQRTAGGQTAAEIARQEGHDDLATRLDELEFAVTDHFSMFLCRQKPDHSTGKHFLIPEMTNPSEQCKEFRRHLQAIPSTLFEKLCQDVYDEVDRREVQAQWNAVNGLIAVGRYDSKHVAVFLPPNANLTATRNQLRQKLAKYDARDLSQLICDLLKEAKRRFLGEEPSSVDESPRATQQWPNESLQTPENFEQVTDLAETRKSHGSNGTHRSSALRASDRNSNPTLDDYLELKEKLTETDQKLNTVVQTYVQMSKDLQLLQKTVEQMFEERKNLEGQLGNINQQLTLISRRSPPPQIRPFSPAISPIPKPFSPRQNNAPEPKKSPMHRQISLGGPETSHPRREERHGSVPHDSSDGLHQQQHFPDTLIAETEKLIALIKNLLSQLTQPQPQHNNILHLADSINYQISRIIDTIPTAFRAGEVQHSVEEILHFMRALYAKCTHRPLATEETITSAYSVAQSAKKLLISANDAAENRNR